MCDTIFCYIFSFAEGYLRPINFLFCNYGCQIRLAIHAWYYNGHLSDGRRLWKTSKSVNFRIFYVFCHNQESTGTKYRRKEKSWQGGTYSETWMCCHVVLSIDWETWTHWYSDQLKKAVSYMVCDIHSGHHCSHQAWWRQHRGDHSFNRKQT